ncbi:hypothetical protein CpipJ_CPIJ010482 [Culex quinquefasciatus]|uniref:60S ribosomal protein L35 n=1 Tax=Culex quinquefasciatus TaxID=7176 RepID=B0WUQ1_CULQU|nr:hypothetical protein CpipJ_CPIJ010482 [Culex quinquefasciatus]|eukprot:XP_001859172.1 hypothetical protein CpipJ_CPIJ010482 [Culex quinquefasciatus]
MVLPDLAQHGQARLPTGPKYPISKSNLPPSSTHIFPIAQPRSNGKISQQTAPRGGAPSLITTVVQFGQEKNVDPQIGLITETQSAAGGRFYQRPKFDAIRINKKLAVAQPWEPDQILALSEVQDKDLGLYFYHFSFRRSIYQLLFPKTNENKSYLFRERATRSQKQPVPTAARRRLPPEKKAEKRRDISKQRKNLHPVPQVKVKCSELRTKDKKELTKQLEELKTELLNLRVAKVTGGAPSKLSKM